MHCACERAAAAAYATVDRPDWRRAQFCLEINVCQRQTDKLAALK